MRPIFFLTTHSRADPKGLDRSALRSFQEETDQPRPRLEKDPAHPGIHLAKAGSRAARRPRFLCPQERNRLCPVLAGRDLRDMVAHHQYPPFEPVKSREKGTDQIPIEPFDRRDLRLDAARSEERRV